MAVGRCGVGESLESGDTDRGTGVGVPVMYEESCKPIDRTREFWSFGGSLVLILRDRGEGEFDELVGEVG